MKRLFAFLVIFSLALPLTGCKKKTAEKTPAGKTDAGKTQPAKTDKTGNGNTEKTPAKTEKTPAKTEKTQ